MIKYYCFLLLLLCSFSFAQIKSIHAFTYENKKSDCERCFYFKIKNNSYEIDESKNILKNGKIIYKCEANYLLDFAVYKKKCLIITYYDMADAHAALGFQYRGIIKLTTIDIGDSNLINNYICEKKFSLVQLKKINANGELVVEKTIKPEER